jgi:poly-gamma-glutamate synthesis protein (capsule biosynthesis protein)
MCAVCAGLILLQQLPGVSLQFSTGLFNPAPKEQKLLLFTGDVFLGRAVERWIARDSANHVFAYLTEVLQAYERVVLNFEAAVPATHVPTPDFGFQFSVATSSLSQLDQFTPIASLANNHTFDFGTAGYESTVRLLQQQGIDIFGHPNQLSEPYVTNTDPRVALIGLNQFGTPTATTTLESLVAEAAVQADYVVAYVHWGNEYTTELSTQQHVLTNQLAAAGVDVIIGHHPHVLQPIRLIADTLVVYSLGNTVFDQYFSEAVQRGMLVGLEVAGGDTYLNLYPISSLTSPHQPQLELGEQRLDALTQLAAMSEPDLQAYIEAGRIPLLRE